MDQRTNRTFICSVLFLDIVEYSAKPVEEQIAVKGRFNALLSEIIEDIAVNDRIILDTGDGAAIGFLGDPEDALFVAMELRESVLNEQPPSSPPLSIRMGINLGPVKLVKDINKRLNLIGDGINVGQRVMSFAQPGQLLVSRSYYEVISCLTQEYAKLFIYQGILSDKHIREHGIYAVGHYASDKDSLSGIRSRRNTVVETDEIEKEVGSQPEKSRSNGTHLFGHYDITSIPLAAKTLLQKKWLYIAVPLAVIIILLGAFSLYRSGGTLKPDIAAAVPKQTVAPTSSSNTKGGENARLTRSAQVPATPASSNTKGGGKTTLTARSQVPVVSASSNTKVSENTSLTARTEDPVASTLSNTTGTEKAGLTARAEDSAASSTVNFRIIPWGEIYINGKKKGVSPPLTTVKLKPGMYNVEVKNTTFPTYLKSVEVTSNGIMEIRHKFQ
ncbi:MAG: PEGA domain-containing protein [Syntrophales bacterium]